MNLKDTWQWVERGFSALAKDICMCNCTRIQILCSFAAPERLESALFLVLVLLVVLVLVVLAAHRICAFLWALADSQVAERKSKATSANPSKRENFQTSRLKSEKNWHFPNLFHFFDLISPPCSQPGGRTQAEGYFHKPLETGKRPNITSEIRERLAFSQPFPLFPSHQPTLQPARRQNASRRLLPQTPRNGTTAKHHVWKPRNYTPVGPKQFSISIAAPACISVFLVAPGVGNAGEHSTNHKKHFFILLLSGVCAGATTETTTRHNGRTEQG